MKKILLGLSVLMVLPLVFALTGCSGPSRPQEMVGTWGLTQLQTGEIITTPGGFGWSDVTLTLSANGSSTWATTGMITMTMEGTWQANSGMAELTLTMTFLNISIPTVYTMTLEGDTLTLTNTTTFFEGTEFEEISTQIHTFQRQTS